MSAKAGGAAAAWAAATCVGVFGEPALAQRASENAVTAAEDAFGVSVGREAIGLYSTSSVRGFSPVSAGNVRIDGLYFDQVWSLHTRLYSSRTIRVGLSALGFPFPSPTGVVDYAFQKPGEDALLSAYASLNTYTGATVEFDGVVPLNDTLSLGLGASFHHNEFSNNTDLEQHVEAVSLRWRPSASVEILPFWSRVDTYGDEIGPTYVPSGQFLPPTAPRRRYVGPDWAVDSNTSMNYGVLSTFALAEGWALRAGAFRSATDDHTSYVSLFLGTEPDGFVARHVIVSQPPSKSASTSGEVRLTRSLVEGDRLHLIHASLRGRDRRERFGGGAEIDLGPTRIEEFISAPEPAFAFGPQTFDEVRQWTAGLAYEGRWRGVGEISASIQTTDYHKEVILPGLGVAATDASPLLYNATAGVYLTPALVVYAGVARGLEESGVAPDIATNRGEALPAIETKQRDAGLRWSLSPDLRLTAGVFDVRKPYFNLDQANLFTLLGDVRHQGVEVSLSGAVSPRLDIVAGGVFLRPRVTGDGVRLGRVGEKPVGQTPRTLTFNLDWRPPGTERLSFDIGVLHEGPRTATRDNSVDLPPRTIVNLGGRLRFAAAGAPASFRLAVTNLFEDKGLRLDGNNAYELYNGRIVEASIAADF